MIWIILCIIVCGGIIAASAIINSKLIKKIKKQYNEHFELSKDLEKLKNEISDWDKEKEQLFISKFKLITEVNDLNEKKNSYANDMTKVKDEILAGYHSYEDNLNKQYLSIEDDFDRKISDLQERYEATCSQYFCELEKEKLELDNIKEKRRRTVEVLNREQAELEDEENHCLKITAADIADINTLEKIRPQLSKPRVLSMLIWSTWFQKPMTELCNKLIGTSVKSGIYKITNILTNECYIGQATDLAKRFKEHAKCGLGIDTPQGHKLYKAMQENGLWNFSWSVLEYCSSAELNERESFYIDLFNSYNYGYNQNQGIRKS